MSGSPSLMISMVRMSSLEAEDELEVDELIELLEPLYLSFTSPGGLHITKLSLLFISIAILYISFSSLLNSFSHL